MIRFIGKEIAHGPGSDINFQVRVDEEEGSQPRGWANRYNAGKIERSAEAFRVNPHSFPDIENIFPEVFVRTKAMLR